jgi:3-methyl-2-oxobutanoate hydroxymethyltransferase
MLDLAHEHEHVGAFSLVLEHVPANVASQTTDAVTIPTIGIGAGPDCDGQVLTVDEVIGLTEEAAPFSKQFGNVREEMRSAIEEFREAVENEEFPAEEHSHHEDGIGELY